MRRFPALAAAALAAVFLASCGASSPSIAIGSKNFSENLFLAELMAQQIEAETDLAVARRLNLGGTFLCHQGLISGELDLYPEYTGTALTAILEKPVVSDPGRVLKIVSQAYRERFQAVWGEPFGFNNTFAIVVRDEEAMSGIRTISDLAETAPDLTLGCGFEFLDREDGYDGLVETYGLEFDGPPKAMDLNLVYRALRDSQIDVGVGNSTDGLIAAFNLRVLEDDRGYFPPYDAAPVVRAETLTAYPALRAAIEKLGGLLDEKTMRKINYELDGKQRPAAELAREFRRSKGLAAVAESDNREP